MTFMLKLANTFKTPPVTTQVAPTIVLDNNIQNLLFLYTKYPHLFAEGDKQQLFKLILVL